MFAATSPFALIIGLGLVLLMALLLSPMIKLDTGKNSIASIDGLRGYLAIFVFFHHSSIWRFYLTDGHWVAPPPYLYRHLGESSVAVFFMITAFLFYSKVIDLDKKRIDWFGLYVSRVCRLMPLYFLVVIAVIVIALMASPDLSKVNWADTAVSIARWVTFTVFGATDIAGTPMTSKIVAGVTWSLPYEWFFYLSLPAIALLTGKRVSKGYAALGLLFFVLFFLWHPQRIWIAAFIFGALTAQLVRIKKFKDWSNSLPGTLAAFASVAIAVFLFTGASYGSVFLFGVAFSIIAAGNTLFGVLSARVSRVLGESAYSIYLLHGILLYVAFKFILGFEASARLTMMQHWLVIFVCAVILVPLSLAAFKFIEAPGMAQAKKLSVFLRSLLPTGVRAT